MGQTESTNSAKQNEKIVKQKQMGESVIKNENITPTPGASSFLKEPAAKSQKDIVDQLTNSRLHLKMQRESEIKKVSESKEKDVLSKILKIMEQNQDQLVEILDERVQLINQNLEDKLLVLENKLDEINDKLNNFENTFYQEFKQSDVKEELGNLRNEVKQMVAISEKYIKDENKYQEIQNLSVLHKSIHKENKPTKKELNPLFNKLSLMRERSKIQKHMSDSQILKEFDENTGYSYDHSNNYNHQSGFSMLNTSQFFNQLNHTNDQYNYNDFQSKIE